MACPNKCWAVDGFDYMFVASSLDTVLSIACIALAVSATIALLNPVATEQTCGGINRPFQAFVYP